MKRRKVKPKDVVFVLHKDYMSSMTNLITIPVIKRGKNHVMVENCCSETNFRTKLRGSMYFDYPEDAVKSFAKEVKRLELEAREARQSLEVMRKEFLSD